MRTDGTLSTKQQQLVVAMLAHPSVAEAAAACNLSKRTAYNWLKQDEFKQALRVAQHELFEERLNVLRTGIGAALNALARNMADSKNIPASVQVRAATVWLEQAITIHKIDDVLSELKDLRRMLADANQR